MPTLKIRLVPRIYVVAAAAIVLCLVSAMSLWASATVSLPEPSATSLSRVASQPVPNLQRPRDPASQAPSSVTVETVALTPTGFEPNELSRAAGKFLLGIDNRIKPEEFSFELVQEDGHKVRKLKMERGVIRLRKLMNLPAGRYLLREVGHPDWTCSIVLSE